MDVDGLLRPPLDDDVVVARELQLGGPGAPHPHVPVGVALRLRRGDRRHLHPGCADEPRRREGPRPEDQRDVRVVGVLVRLAVLPEEPGVPSTGAEEQPRLLAPGRRRDLAGREVYLKSLAGPTLNHR